MLIRVGTRLALLIVILATVGCDRVTKHMASASLAGRATQSFLADTVRLTYTENAGGFLGLGADLPPEARTGAFILGSGIMLGAVVLFAFRRRRSPWQTTGLALFVAGGGSNWVDRVFHGSVVDFMNVGVGWLRTGIFNVADVAIMIGFAMLLLPELWKGGHESW
jgi:signal peptidase II